MLIVVALQRKHKKIKKSSEELNDVDNVALNEIDVEEKQPNEATDDEDLDMIDNRVPFQGNFFVM